MHVAVLRGHGPMYVRLSVTSRHSIETAERIALDGGTEAAPSLSSYTVLQVNSGVSKNKGTSLWNLVVPNSELGRFVCFSPRHFRPSQVLLLDFYRCKLISLSVHRCLQHVSRDAERCTVRCGLRQLKLHTTTLPNVHSGPK